MVTPLETMINAWYLALLCVILIRQLILLTREHLCYTYIRRIRKLTLTINMKITIILNVAPMMSEQNKNASETWGMLID